MITDFDNTVTGDNNDISFNYGTSLNSNGNIILSGTAPSTGVSNFYSGVSFPQGLQGISPSVTIGDVYVCFGGSSIVTLNATHDITSQLYANGDGLAPIGTFAFVDTPNFGSSLGQFGTCATLSSTYYYFNKNSETLPYLVKIETTLT